MFVINMNNKTATKTNEHENILIKYIIQKNAIKE